MNGNKNAGGITLAGAVFLVFMTLKLTGHIDWSWWWVTCPLWAVPAVCLAIAVIIAAGWLVVRAFKAVGARWRRYRAAMGGDA
jgi:hypothetical protein